MPAEANGFRRETISSVRDGLVWPEVPVPCPDVPWLWRDVPGAADTGIEQEEDQSQVRLRLDRQALARYGINVRDVQDVIELAIGGKTVSTFFEGERRFDISVRYVPEARTDLSAIGTVVDEIIAGNPDKVEQVKTKPAMMGWFVGQVMKASGGKANPQAVNELLRKKLGL